MITSKDQQSYWLKDPSFPKQFQNKIFIEIQGIDGYLYSGIPCQTSQKRDIALSDLRIPVILQNYQSLEVQKVMERDKIVQEQIVDQNSQDKEILNENEIDNQTGTQTSTSQKQIQKPNGINSRTVDKTFRMLLFNTFKKQIGISVEWINFLKNKYSELRQTKNYILIVCAIVQQAGLLSKLQFKYESLVYNHLQKYKGKWKNDHTKQTKTQTAALAIDKFVKALRNEDFTSRNQQYWCKDHHRQPQTVKYNLQKMDKIRKDIIAKRQQIYEKQTKKRQIQGKKSYRK